jgi:putative membrane protein
VHGEPEPPEALAEKIAGHSLSRTELAVASESLHWGFGAAAGAAYGALAEYFPAATAKEGATFGLTLMTLTHEGALPALGVAAEPEDQSFREHTSEAATHVLYGVVAEKVRGFVRGLLD